MAKQTKADAAFRALDEARLLALCLWGEARGETMAGKIAVASVIVNRAKAGGWFGATVRDVILKPKQFSCFNAGDPNHIPLCLRAQLWNHYIQKDKALRECFRIAEGVLSGAVKGNVGGATHYKTTACAASWAASMERVAVIGNHEFFEENSGVRS